jgi:hypothetical protein
MLHIGNRKDISRALATNHDSRLSFGAGGPVTIGVRRAEPSSGHRRFRDSRKKLKTCRLAPRTDDPIVLVANAHIMNRLLPHATVYLHNGGHIDVVTNAAELVPVIETFLRAPGEP